MPIQIQVPGMGLAEFPDGVSYSDAFDAIKQDAPDFEPSRADVFAAMRQKSEAFAGPDKQRFAGDTGAIQGFLEQTAGKTAGGLGSITSAAGRVLDIPLDPYFKSEEKAGRPVNRIESKFRNPFQEAADLAEASDTTGATSRFLSDTAGGVLPSLTAGLLTGGIGAGAIAGTQQFGDTRKRVLDYYKQIGLPEYEAQNTADQLGALSGVITGAVTKYTPEVLGKIPGIGKYLGEQGAEGLAKKLLVDRLKQGTIGEIAKRVVGNAVGEATEEGVNQFLLEVVESKQLEPNLSWQEIAKRTGMAAAQGAVGGGAVSAVGEVARKGMDAAITKAYPDANQRYGDDAVREHVANQLSEMFGLPPVHTDRNTVAKPPPIPQQAQVAPAVAPTATTQAAPNPFEKFPFYEDQITPPPIPNQTAAEPAKSQIEISPEAAVEQSAKQPEPSGSIGSKMVRAIGIKSLTAIGVDPEVATQFADLVSGRITANTTEEARDQIQKEFRNAGFLDAGANTFSTEANIRNAQEAEGWNESDVQNMLHDRRARDKDIFAHNKKLIGELVAKSATQIAPEAQTKPASEVQSDQKQTLADKVYNKLDEWDKGLNQNTYSSITGFEIPIAKLVLKTAKLAIRAGQSVSQAIRGAIEKAKKQYPDAKFDHPAFEKQILADLQPLLSGKEESSTIAQAAEPFVKQNEDAASKLDQAKLTKTQIQKARQDLDEAHGYVVQKALAIGLPYSDVPSKQSTKLAEFAAEVGASDLKIADIQTRLNHEERAQELHKVNSQIEDITAAESKLSKAGPQKYSETLKFLAESKQKLQKKAANKNFDDVRQRASEIATTEKERIQNTAKRDALQNGHVVEAITGPVEEMRKLLEDTPEIRGRTAEQMMADPLVSDDTKQLFVIRMSSAFREFDKAREDLESSFKNADEVLQSAIDKLTGKLTDARMDKAFAEIVLSDARRAVKGEAGLTGGLNPAWVEWYDNNQSALRSFARSLSMATGQYAIEAQKLMDWIRFGVDASAMPDVKNTAAHNWGVGDEVLNEIKKILLESRATRNAVALIYGAGSQSLAAHDLRKIATAAMGGDQELSNALFDKLVNKTDAEKAKLSAMERELSDELEKKVLEIETLKEAKLLFDKVASSPTFLEGRHAVEGSEKSFMQQFLVRQSGQFGFSGFKMPDGTEQGAIVVNGSKAGEGDFSAQAGNEILKWKDSATAYVTGYEMAENDFENGAGPSPVQLGYDPAVYRGLRYTLNYEMAGILDGTLFHPDTGVDYSGVNQLGQTWQWFRQIDATAKLVKGIFGNAFRQSVAEFRDANMALATIASDPRFNEIPRLLSTAMAGHKSAGVTSLNKLGRVGKSIRERFAINGNIDKYRELVFNPMANLGRGFGTLKVGTVLHTGEVVTQADIDLLKRTQERDRALLKLAQKRGKGQSQQFGGKEFRREAGSVGDLGTPRHVNDKGETFITKLASAAFNLKRDAAFNWAQLQSGDHPILQVWKRAAMDHFALNSHVHDSAYRTDRDVQVHPFMRQAYRDLAATMEAGGYLNKIESVGELAEKLVQHFPDGTGFDPRTFVLEQLNNEFDQYNRNAIGYIDNISKVSGEPVQVLTADNGGKYNGVAMARGRNSSIIETETSNNEFTKPAAQLKIPSAFYDYSSMSPLDMTLSKSRAIGEKVVDMKNALRSSIQGVQSSLDVLSSGDQPAREKLAKTMNLSIQESIAYLENVRDALQGIDDALGRNYQKDNPVVATAKSALGLMVGGALTSINAATVNILSSSASAYVLHGMINRGGKAALAWSTAKFASRVPRNFIYSVIHALGDATAKDFEAGWKYLDKHAPALSSSLEQAAHGLKIRSILGAVSNYSGYSQFSRDVASVRGLGFSQPRNLFQNVANAIRQSVQYVDGLEQEKKTGVVQQTKRIGELAVKIPARVVGEALKFTLLELGDTTINATTMASMRDIEASYKDLAKKWASDRISKGMQFDPSNPEFLVRPDEYRKHGALGRLTSQDNLAHARAFAQLAGTNLEQMLWDYYQKSDKGTKDTSVFGENEDAMKRIMVGAINASTFTNRPLKAQTNTDVGVIQALTGFQTNMAIGILNALKGSQSNPRTAINRMRKLFEALGKIIGGIVAFLLIGTVSTGVAEWVNRKVSGKIARKMVPMDKEFWNVDAKLPWRIAKLGLSVAPFLGALGRIDEGIRPDVSGGIFAVSAMNMLANFIVGAIKVQPEDLGWLAHSISNKIFPITQAAPIGDNGPDSSRTKLSAGVASYAAAVDAAGLTKPNLQGPASGLAPINEKTPMLAKLAEAGMSAAFAEKKGDLEGLAEANKEIEHQRNRLIDYHRKQIVEDNQRRGVESNEFKVEKDAISAARRDWQDMNPIARVLGHAPTQSEMDRIDAQLSGDRRAAADLAWNSFSRMSESFPNAKGATPDVQMVKRMGGGGGSRFGGGMGGASIAMASSGVRRASSRRSRASLGRGRIRGRGLRSGRIRARR